VISTSSSFYSTYGETGATAKEAESDGDGQQRGELCWELASCQDVGIPCMTASWGPGPNAHVFSVVNDKTVQSVRNSAWTAVMGEGVAAVQLSASELSLERVKLPSIKISIPFRFAGMAIDPQRLVVWSGKSLEVYNIDPKSPEPFVEAKFDFRSQCIAVRGQTLYLTNENFVYLSNLKGTIKQSLPFTAEEGDPCFLSLSPAGYLAVATRLGVIKVLDVRGTEAVLKAAPWRFTKGSPVSLSVNADGSAVSIQCVVFPDELNEATAEQLRKASIPDTRIHVFSVEKGILHSYDYGNREFYPVSHCWDAHDPRFFTVALKRLIRDTSDGSWHDSRDRHLEV
jgi:hypothetical protein